MSKFLLSAGMVWVFLSLIIGILLVSNQPVRLVIQKSNTAGLIAAPGTEQYRAAETAATAKVQIAGTPEPTANTAETSVKIKK